MAEFIPVSLIKNNVTECPICTEQFEEEVRIPRRMPCCVQSICQPCLKTYSRGKKKVSCPMCRCEHLLPGGVTSLAKEPLILRILEQLKIQKGVKIPCTDCPDKNSAVARCEECCISLCEECLRAHGRLPTLRNHSVKTFEELKGLPIENVKRKHQCEEHHHPLEFYCTTCDKVICVSCTVLEHEKGDNHCVVSINKAHKERSEVINAFLTKLVGKEEDLTEAVRKLELERDTLKVSSDKAREDVTATFDSLIEDLELKKATLLSELDHRRESYLKQLQERTENVKAVLTQVRSSTEYIRNMRRKADQIEDIQLISSSLPSLRIVQEKQVKDLQPIDIEVEVDAMKELADVVKSYLQEHSSAGRTLPGLLNTLLRNGDSWFLMDTHINWFKAWRLFAGWELPKDTTGPINNGRILTENGGLKPNLVEGLDYIPLPEESWNELVTRYGVVDKQLPIRRKVITLGSLEKHCKIEVYKLKLHLSHIAQDEDIRIRHFSRADTIGHLEKVMREEFDIAKKKNVCLWTRCIDSYFERLDNHQQTLDISGLNHEQEIFIEEMRQDVSSPIEHEIEVKNQRRRKSKKWKHGDA